MKTPAALLIFAGLVVFAGIFAGEYFFKGYSPKENTISDLGQRIDPINTSIKSSIIFNSAMILSGIAIAVAAHLLHTQLHKNLITIPLFIHGIAIIGVGIFNTSFKPTHLIFAIITFISVELASMACLSFDNNSKYLLAIFGAFSFVFLIGNFALAKSLGTGTAERLIVYPTTLWLIVFGVFLFSLKKTLH